MEPFPNLASLSDEDLKTEIDKLVEEEQEVSYRRRLLHGRIDMLNAERVARLQQMTPEKIAPLVVYLGSDKAAGISGQIFSVRNNEIFLFNQTRPIRAIHRADGWTPEKLDAQLKGAFAPSFTPLDRSGDVFSWDPI